MAECCGSSVSSTQQRIERLSQNLRFPENPRLPQAGLMHFRIPGLVRYWCTLPLQFPDVHNQIIMLSFLQVAQKDSLRMQSWQQSAQVRHHPAPIPRAFCPVFCSVFWSLFKNNLGTTLTFSCCNSPTTLVRCRNLQERILVRSHGCEVICRFVVCSSV